MQIDCQCRRKVRLLRNLFIHFRTQITYFKIQFKEMTTFAVKNLSIPLLNLKEFCFCTGSTKSN